MKRCLVLASLALALCACGGAAQKGPVKPVVTVKPPDPSTIRPKVSPITDVRFPTPTVTVVQGGRGDQPPELGSDGPVTRHRGVEIIAVERRATPAIHFRWLIPGGRALELGNDGRNRMRWPAGTMSLLAEMMVEGSRNHRGAAFAAALERIGASLEVTAGSDAMILSGQVLSHQLEPLLGLVTEALLTPELDGKLLETKKKQHLAELQSIGTRPRAAGSRVFNRLVYGADHPYGAPGLTETSVGKITRRHLEDAHRAAFGVDGSSLVVVGDVDVGKLAQGLRDRFGRALEQRSEAVGALPVAKPEPVACHVVDLKDASQSVILQGNPGPARADAAWPTIVVANQILGGSASSRLFSVLRERKGLTYGIYSALDGRLRAGDWAISGSVRTAKTTEALEAIATEVEMMRNAAASAEELGAAQRFLVGQFVLSTASSAEVANKLAAVRLFGLPESAWDRYAAAITAADAEQVRSAAQRTFGTAQQQTVIVGDLDKLRPALDNLCARIDLRDVDGERIRTVVGPDAAMTDADRAALFHAWGANAAARPALERYARDGSIAIAHRAAAVHAALAGPQHATALAAVAGAADAAALASAVVERLVPELRDDAMDRARAAKAWLLDLSAPLRGTALLDAAGRARAQAAIAQWAFAGVGPDSAALVVQTLARPRLDEADLARLHDSAVDGLEALVSSDVWRESAAKALLALNNGAAIRALVRGYRRALVVRRGTPSSADLQLLGSVADVQTALLLLDTHALLELVGRDGEAAELPQESTAAVAHATREQARAATMQTLRDVIDALAEAPSREAGKAEGRSVLERDFRHLQGHLEAVLTFRNADDRWWAASLLVRHRSAEGLRLTLSGLADDDHYNAPAWHTTPPIVAAVDLCRDEIAKLGVELARPQLLAALAGRHRVAKVLAIVTMRVWGDDGSLTALRTHVDATDVGALLGLGRPLSVTELARAAVDFHRVARAIDADREAGRIDADTAQRRNEAALYAIDQQGAALDAVVAAVGAGARAAPTGPAATTPARESTRPEADGGDGAEP